VHDVKIRYFVICNFISTHHIKSKLGIISVANYVRSSKYCQSNTTEKIINNNKKKIPFKMRNEFQCVDVRSACLMSMECE